MNVFIYIKNTYVYFSGEGKSITNVNNMLLKYEQENPKQQ